MSEFETFDLDRSTGRAWRRFQARLADHVVAMEDDDVLVVSADSAVGDDAAGAAPYVQFCGWGDGLVRAEVSSNAYLAPEAALDGTAEAMVVALGWQPPSHGRDDEPDGGSANFFLDLDRTEADRLAVLATQTLRQVFGVPHPAFLVADGLETGRTDTPAAVLPAPEVESPATFPDSREHLLGLVDQALTPVFGGAPEHDEDGDIPVVCGTALVYVRVLERLPGVSLFCALVHGVTDRERAAVEVALLNRDERLLKFVLDGDRVMAQVFLPAYPFAPEHLRTMLAAVTDAVDTLDDDLVVRVGGCRTFEPEQPDDEAAPLHPAMQTLLQLDADEPGSVTPELAASVCAGDRDLVLALIAWNTEQEAEWRAARDAALDAAALDAAEPGEAEVCGREADRARDRVELLRHTLRLLAERQLEQDRARSAAGDPHRRPRAGRRRRGRDRPLPGLEPRVDEPGLFDGGGD